MGQSSQSVTRLLRSIGHRIRGTRVAVLIVRVVVVMSCVDPVPLTGSLLLVVLGSTLGLAPANAERAALLVGFTTSFDWPGQPECDTRASFDGSLSSRKWVAVHIVRVVVVMCCGDPGPLTCSLLQEVLGSTLGLASLASDRCDLSTFGSEKLV